MSDDIQFVEGHEGDMRALFEKAHALVSGARAYIGQTANYATVLTSFELGRYIVEEKQRGENRAAYGAHVLELLSSFLTERFGRGFSRRNLSGMRMFYLTFRDRESQIWQSAIAKSAED